MLILDILELLFILMVLGIILLFIFSFSLAWSWAHHRGNSQLDWADLISAAAVEWGAFLSLAVAQIRRLKHFYEAPPLKMEEASPQQIPVIFVPSLHTRSSIFSLLMWRLKKNYWNSLWAFDWKAFIHEAELLEDQLRSFIETVVKTTEARRFRIVSFGSSRPIVARVLDGEDLKAYCDRWIAVSAACKAGSGYQFLSTARLRAAYQSSDEDLPKPDLMICGETDFFCFPPEIFGDSKKITLPNVGHYASLLHSSTTQALMKELSS